MNFLQISGRGNWLSRAGPIYLAWSNVNLKWFHYNRAFFPAAPPPCIFLSSYHSRRKKWAARAFCSVSPLARPDGPPPNLLSVDLYNFSYLYFSIYLYLYYVIYTTPSTTTHNESVTPGTIRCKELSTHGSWRGPKLKKTPIFFVDAKRSQIAQGFQKCKF